jgi:hypothetical protein
MSHPFAKGAVKPPYFYSFNITIDYRIGLIWHCLCYLFGKRER